MFSKIFSSMKLANAFKGLLFKRILSPLQSARIINVILDIKNTFSENKNKADSICKTLDLMSNFKKEHPQDFNEMLEIFKEFLQDYEKNPYEIKQNIKEFLNK